MKRRGLLLAALLMLGSGAAYAQAPAPAGGAPANPPTRVRGTLTAVHGNDLSVTSRTGDKLTIAMAPNAAVSQVLRAKLSDVKDGSYIGTAAMPQADGSLVAMEIQLFPEAMRGVGEGNRPWDLKPGSSMTNGTVGSVSGKAGRSLTLNYKDGSKQVTIPPHVPVITYASGTTADLKKGSSVMLNVTKQADGSMTADRVWVGKGVKIPM